MSDLYIRQAIREVLTGVLQGVRPIEVDTLQEITDGGATDYARAVSAMVLPSFDLSLSYSPAEDQVTQPSPIWIEKVDLLVKVIYKLDAGVLDPAQFGEIKSESAALGKQIRLALTWPGKLSLTDNGEDTEIVSGMLIWTGSEVTQDAKPDKGDQGIYITEHTFTGFVKSVEAVS